MDMTHEQKPESAEFRTREAQIASHFGPHFLADFTEEGLRKELIEAEARGAAEQRRKDAEGAEPVKWQRQNPGHGWIDTAEEDLPFYKERGLPVGPLYDHPANVAALEDRVRELEGEIERLKKPEFYAVSDLEDSWFSTEELMDSLDGDIPHFGTVEIDCFRRVSRIWAFYDGKKVREFANKGEAEAAAAAAIREGGEHE